MIQEINGKKRVTLRCTPDEAQWIAEAMRYASTSTTFPEEMRKWLLAMYHATENQAVQARKDNRLEAAQLAMGKQHFAE
jgi:hypothetical protein